jgi:hypothetical protein
LLRGHDRRRRCNLHRGGLYGPVRCWDGLFGRCHLDGRRSGLYGLDGRLRGHRDGRDATYSRECGTGLQREAFNGVVLALLFAGATSLAGLDRNPCLAFDALRVVSLHQAQVW